MSSPYLPAWGQATLPQPPSLSWRRLVGPGLLMVGASIGGGEWLFGSVVTARYGASVMWLAGLSILFQVLYNLAVMRYTLFTGEPILVGFLRTWPGPRFWALAYLSVDLGYIWPYLAANAAVPLAAAWLGHMPDAGDDGLVRRLGYGIFLTAFLPLIFGKKVYTAVERVMSFKVVLVLVYLVVVNLLFVSPAVWGQIALGFLQFGVLPKGAAATAGSASGSGAAADWAAVDWATLAAFAAVAGAGGLSNTLLSNYVRDKGWGMGAAVGAIPSLVGGRSISLSHIGKTPLAVAEAGTTGRWQGWVRLIGVDQWGVWAVGCVLGVALPAALSLQYLQGAKVEGHGAAALIAERLAAQHGAFFWYATLLCGFLILAPGVIQTIDGVCRRWTDVAWCASPRLRQQAPERAYRVYYAIMGLYCAWGLLALGLTPNPLVLAIFGSVLGNVGLAISALHVIAVHRRLLPAAYRCGVVHQAGLLLAGLFFAGISAIALASQWNNLSAAVAGLLARNP